MVQRFHQLVQPKEEAKAAQPHQQRLPCGNVGHVEIKRLFGSNSVVPYQLVLLGKGARGEGQALKGGLQGHGPMMVAVAAAAHEAARRGGKQGGSGPGRGETLARGKQKRGGSVGGRVATQKRTFR